MINFAPIFRERLQGNHIDRNDDSFRAVKSPIRPIPVLADYDVVVVGGGTSGVPAGIAAGRQGMKTLVLEHLHLLGGIGTAGGIGGYWYGNHVGFSKEVMAGHKYWYAEHKSHWWLSALAEAGTEVWCGVMAIAAYTEGNRVRGVLVATPEGIGVVTGKIVIDATGNADIAVAAGARLQPESSDEIAVQGAGLSGRYLRPSLLNSDFMLVDETDMVDASHVFVYAKEKYPAAFDQGKLISTRERRQILGEFTFDALDQINGRTYPDTIMYGFSDYDTHGFTIDPYMELNHPHPKRYFAYVPYRSSIPVGLEGILVAGLATSCHRDALPIVRMQADLQNQGYALGLATAMLVRENAISVRDLNVRELQKQLVEIGNLDPVVLTQEDNYESSRKKLPQAVKLLPTHFRESVSLVMWYPEESRTLVHKAYLHAGDFESKLIYARVAAALGDAIGVPTLLEKLASYPKWDKGWNFRGMGHAGAATSPMDQFIMMLGRTCDSRAIPLITARARELTAESEFSHFRAVCLALQNIGGKEAAETLALLLSKPGVTGHVHDTIEKAKKFDQSAPGGINQEKPRRDSLIELSLARALYRCGDIDGRGEKILRAYTKDLRGYFSRHAMRELLDR